LKKTSDIEEHRRYGIGNRLDLSSVNLQVRYCMIGSSEAQGDYSIDNAINEIEEASTEIVYHPDYQGGYRW
jgi:hypothetical protein